MEEKFTELKIEDKKVWINYNEWLAYTTWKPGITQEDWDKEIEKKRNENSK